MERLNKTILRVIIELSTLFTYPSIQNGIHMLIQLAVLLGDPVSGQWPSSSCGCKSPCSAEGERNRERTKSVRGGGGGQEAEECGGGREEGYRGGERREDGIGGRGGGREENGEEEQSKGRRGAEQRG